MPQKRRGRPKTRLQKQAKQRRWMMLGGIAIVVTVVAAVILIDALRAPKVEGVEEFTDLGNSHLQAEPSSYLWNSRPPTSGPHAPSIASWGEHTESVPEWYQVHNLEDGGVIIHYNCPDGCPEMVDELRAIVNEKGSNQLMLHPYSHMDSTIALTAWTRLLQLDTVDRDRIIEFIDAYRGMDHHR
jgi:hypothetical protein